MLCNSPGNPTGKIISDSVLKRIENWTEQNGILLIRDEAYSGFEYVPNASPPLSALTIPKPNSVLVRSFSKILGIPGERLGYLVADKILIDRISQAHLWLALTPPAYSLELVSGLVACWDATKHQKLLNELLERRNLAAETLSVAPEVSFTLPQGGIFIWMSIKGIASGVEFAKNCFDWEKLIVVAGEEFGGEKQCYARISFAVSRNDLLTGLEALIRVVKKMQIN
jgi:aspartate/methionine/tyrosine aminotransferase